MRKDWHGLVKILEIEHKAKDGSTLWKDKNVYNILHFSGQALILNAMFTGGRIDNAYIPDSYYLGLDYRPFVNASDTMETINAEGSEPNTNGYNRQVISSLNQFTVSNIGGVTTAASPIISFSAAGGAWGPARNLFLTTAVGNLGTLIASVPLSQAITVDDGETVSLRISLSLQDYPAQ